jgi:hypothetical protein
MRVVAYGSNGVSFSKNIFIIGADKVSSCVEGLSGCTVLNKGIKFENRSRLRSLWNFA